MLRNLFNVIFILMACVAILTGCSTEKKASKENFKKAVSEWQQQSGGYLAGTSTLPVSIPVTQAPKIVVRNFADLSIAGMVTVVKEQAAQGAAKGTPEEQYTYTLTDLGKKYFTPGKGFKTTNPEVTEITEFTVQADAKPNTAIVKYKYNDVPTELGKLVNKSAKADIYDGVIKLVLTDKGWKSTTTGY